MTPSQDSISIKPSPLDGVLVYVNRRLKFTPPEARDNQATLSFLLPFVQINGRPLSEQHLSAYPLEKRLSFANQLVTASLTVSLQGRNPLADAQDAEFHAQWVQYQQAMFEGPLTWLEDEPPWAWTALFAAAQTPAGMASCQRLHRIRQHLAFWALWQEQPTPNDACALWESPEGLRLLGQAQLPPFRRVIWVEGKTEELLLPAFAQALGINLHAEGLLMVGQGGKNAILKSYPVWASQLAIPLDIMLDADAQTVADKIHDAMEHHPSPARESDAVIVLPGDSNTGEIEDLLPEALIFETLNTHFPLPPPFHPITQWETLASIWPDVTHPMRQVSRLQRLWQRCHLGTGQFDKITFAQAIIDTLMHHPQPSNFVPEGIRALFAYWLSDGEAQQPFSSPDNTPAAQS